MIDIILIEPETSGNIGAVARVMKNFGFKKLVLINPVKIDEDAKKRAKHGNDVLTKAKKGTFRLLNKYDYLVGTTSKLGNDFNIRRCTLTTDELKKKILPLKRSKIGIVFGREGKGLFNKEIEMCDFLVSIRTSKKYPALNLSHSVAIILHELSTSEKIGENITPISKKEKDVLIGMINKKLKKMEFTTPEKRQTQKTVWKKMIGKAMLTKREAFALMGFFRK